LKECIQAGIERKKKVSKNLFGSQEDLAQARGFSSS